MSDQELFEMLVNYIVINADHRTQEKGDYGWIDESYSYTFRKWEYMITLSVDFDIEKPITKYHFVRVKTYGVSGSGIDTEYSFFYNGKTMREFLDKNRDSEVVAALLEELK